MNGVIIAGVLGLAALLVVGIVLSRATTRQKQEAIASLEAERKAIGTVSILDLVHEEVEDLGLREIDGADDVAPDILLRAWNDAPDRVRAADRSDVRLTIRSGADPEHLDVGDARFVLGDGAPTTSDSDVTGLDEAGSDVGGSDGARADDA
jgi:hypothetical protein